MDNIVSEKEVDITSLEVALRSAGDNRGELEKVLWWAVCHGDLPIF